MRDGLHSGNREDVSIARMILLYLSADVRFVVAMLNVSRVARLTAATAAADDTQMAFLLLS